MARDLQQEDATIPPPYRKLRTPSLLPLEVSPTTHVRSGFMIRRRCKAARMVFTLPARMGRSFRRLNCG